jgi:hypothetical protein
MYDVRTERASCRFLAEKGEGGKQTIRIQFFTRTVPILAHASLGFNLLAGISPEQANKIAEMLNDSVLDVFVALSSDHPMFGAK